MYHKPTSPGTIGQVLDSAFRLFKQGFVYCMPATIAVAVANAAPQLLNVSPELLFQNPWVLLPLALGAYYLIALTTPMLVHRMSGFADGARVPFSTNAKLGLRKSLPVLGAFILYGLAILAGTLLLIVPGVILTVSLGLFLYAMVIDDFGALAALKHSHRLVWGNWWRTTAIFTVGLALVMVLYVIAGVILGFFAAFTMDESTGPSGGGLISFVLVLISNFFVAPLFVALGLAIYTDLNLRKRGEDLEARVDELQTG